MEIGNKCNRKNRLALTRRLILRDNIGPALALNIECNCRNIISENSRKKIPCRHFLLVTSKLEPTINFELHLGPLFTFIQVCIIQYNNYHGR